jgi:hypothetical protein
MEEADALGDKVAIMHQGRLRAVGTSLFLKAKFGKGHTISILSDAAKAPEVQEIVRRCMPSAEIIASTAGNTSIGLPRAAVDRIPRLFSELTAVPELVKEWGLSNTTLEEVFLRLAAQDHDVNTAIQQEPNHCSRVMLVRRPAQGSTALDHDVVCLMEGPNADQLQIVTPEELVLQIVEDEEEEDELAPLLEQFVPEGEDHDGDDQVEEVVRGNGVIDFSNPLGNEPATEPVAASGSAVAEQVLAIIVVPLYLGIWIICTGFLLLFLTPISQVLAVMWKDTNLAFGCRKRSGGCTACFTFKCCELGCYIVVFLIFGLAAVLNEFVDGFANPEFGAVYCDNGVLNQTGAADANSGWADKSAWTCPNEDDGSGLIMGSKFHDVCSGNEVYGAGMRWGAGGNPQGNQNYEGNAQIPGEWMHNNDYTCSDENAISTDLCDEDVLALKLVEWASPLARQSDYNMRECMQRCQQQNNGCQDCSQCQGCSNCCQDCQANCVQLPAQAASQCKANLQICGPWGSCFDQMGPWLGDNGGGQNPTLNIWYSTNDGGATDLADLRVFTNRTDWYHTDRQLRRFESAGDIDAAVRAAQHLLRSSAVGLHLVNRDTLHVEDSPQGVHDPDTCPWRTYNPDGRWQNNCFEGRTLDDTQTAQDWWADVFPAMALEVNKATLPIAGTASETVAALVLHYDVRLWSSSEGQSFRYVDVSAAQWSQDGTCRNCNQIGSRVSRPGYPLYGSGETAKNLRRAINEMSNIVLRSINPVLEDCRCTCTCDCGCEHCHYDRCDRPESQQAYTDLIGLDCSGDVTTCGEGQPDNACYYNHGDSCDQPWGNCNPECVDCSFESGDPASCDTSAGCVYRPPGAAPTCVETATGGDAAADDAAACTAVADLGSATACEAVLTKSSDDSQDDTSSAVADLAACTYTAASGGCSIGWLNCNINSKDTSSRHGCADGCIYKPAFIEDGFDREHDCEFRLDTTYVPMPYLKFARRDIEDIPNFWLIMMPMLTMQLIPALASMLAMEKEEGLMEMIATEGGRTDAYFLGNYIFCFVYSAMFSSLFILVLYFSGANENPNVQLPWDATVLTILVWAHAQTCFCGFLGFAIFSRARHAAICGVLVIPLCSIAGWVITAFAKSNSISWMCYILPPLAYSRTVGMLLMFGGGAEFATGLRRHGVKSVFDPLHEHLLTSFHMILILWSLAVTYRIYHRFDPP